MSSSKVFNLYLLLLLSTGITSPTIPTAGLPLWRPVCDSKSNNYGWILLLIFYLGLNHSLFLCTPLVNMHFSPCTTSAAARTSTIQFTGGHFCNADKHIWTRLPNNHYIVEEDVRPGQAFCQEELPCSSCLLRWARDDCNKSDRTASLCDLWKKNYNLVWRLSFERRLPPAQLDMGSSDSF